MNPSDFSTLFELLPIGAYRSSPDGLQMRANPALVRMNGYESEAELLAAVRDIGMEWYVDPLQRRRFLDLMEAEGRVVNFRSEVYRHKSRERIWIRENAHAVRGSDGRIRHFEGTVEDITDSQRALLALSASEQRFRTLTEKAQVMTMVCDADGTILYASDAAREMLGVAADILCGQNLFDMVLAQDQPAARAEMDRVVQGHGQARELVLRYPHADGQWRYLASLVTNFLHEDVIHGVVFDFRDATERKRAERAEQALHEAEGRWKLALESTGDGVWDWDIPAGVERISRRCKEMYGYADDEMSDHPDDLDRLTHPQDKAAMLRDRQNHLDGLTPTYQNEHRIRCRDGTWKWILSRGMVISRDAEGHPLRMIGTHTDITKRKNAEAQVWQQANFDALTGLPNRRMLRDRLEREFRKVDREGKQMAILFVDLDHFKEVNDTLGHDAGDQLLIKAAQRIRSCVRESDTVARMGGDEFTLVLSELGADGQLDRILDAVLSAMSTLFQLGDEQVYISASIGITMYPGDGSDVEALFKNADQALYAAKGAGRNRFRFFTPALQEAALNRVRLANELRASLSEDQFYLVYQPIVSLRDGSVHKAEALIRWQHPVRGLISPGEFIPVAESTGLIIEIGEWVFRTAAAQTARWRSRHDPQFQLSINKSPAQFHNDAGRQHAWVEHLAEIGLPGNAVVVEITEGLLLDTSASVAEQLLDLRQAGIKVSLDDFGTGFSSLTYLQRFDIDYLKIDQSFVRELVPGGTELALCKAIIVMAHELGLQVIAEGVETAAQRDLLISAGCDFGQGYLFAHPMPADALEAMLALNARPQTDGG
jgi:diguanylate cyclase (GGDEF)-like protein/PAS domain S-box-containing protein